MNFLKQLGRLANEVLTQGVLWGVLIGGIVLLPFLLGFFYFGAIFVLPLAMGLMVGLLVVWGGAAFALSFLTSLVRLFRNRKRIYRTVIQVFGEDKQIRGSTLAAIWERAVREVLKDETKARGSWLPTPLVRVLDALRRLSSRIRSWALRIGKRSDEAEPDPPEPDPPLCGVPQLLGLEHGHAVRVLYKAGLAPSIHSDTTGGMGRHGLVVAQDPYANDEVPVGSTVKVFVSRRPPSPDLEPGINLDEEPF